MMLNGLQLGSIVHGLDFDRRGQRDLGHFRTGNVRLSARDPVPLFGGGIA